MLALGRYPKAPSYGNSSVDNDVSIICELSAEEQAEFAAILTQWVGSEYCNAKARLRTALTNSYPYHQTDPQKDMPMPNLDDECVELLDDLDRRNLEPQEALAIIAMALASLFDDPDTVATLVHKLATHFFVQDMLKD